MSDPGGNGADRIRQTHAHAIGRCTYCPNMCRHACPVAEAERSETATPMAKTRLIGLALAGQRPLEEAGRAAYRCTGCYLQERYCLHENRLPDVYHDVRALVLEAGVAPKAAVTFRDRLRDLANPFEAATDLVARVEGTGVPLTERVDGGTVLVPDCTTARYFPQAVRDAHTVLERFLEEKVAVVTLPGGCCGYPHYAVGDRDGFRAVAEGVAATLDGAHRLVFLSPCCVHAIRDLYEQLGLAPAGTVQPLADVLGEHPLRLQRLVNTPYDTACHYHDPCYLGRVLGSYDPPRKALRAVGAEVRELVWARDRAWCSGGGGCYVKVHPEAARTIARRLLADPAAEAGTPIVTACPSCRRMLEGAGGVVLGLESVVARALREERSDG